MKGVIFMKESRKHLVQWIALGLSLAVVVSFLVVLFTTVTVPYRKATYWHEEEQADNLVKVEFEFLDSKKAETRLYVNGELVDSSKGDFKVEDGILFAKSEDETEFTRVGSVNSSQLVLEEGNTVLTCPSTHTYKILCIVFISTFGAIMLGSVAWIIFDKCGSKVVLTEAVEVKKRKKNK